MKSIEIHLIRSISDISSADSCGLVDIRDSRLYCYSCEKTIGLVSGGRMIPLAYVLDDEREAFLCVGCIQTISKALSKP